MRTLTPAQTILRDKFITAIDQEYPDLDSGATLLYLNLFFRLAGQQQDASCSPSLAELASSSMISKHLAYRYTRQLNQLGYIRIEHDGTRNVYRLPLATRVSATNGVAV